ncbi:MAG: ATPase [Hornefia sp.]|nr:ATPase [Hornefia sp.]
MTVLDLLDELDEIVETASTVPLTNKIMVDGSEIVEIVKEIRQSLPDDVQQAKWIKDQKDNILAEAKQEYEKVQIEAKKHADFLIDEHEIVLKAQKKADGMQKEAQEYSTMLKLKTYDYLDNTLYEMQGKFEELNGKYLNELFTYMEKTFQSTNEVLEQNRAELKEMASRTKNGEDWLYNKDQ